MGTGEAAERPLKVLLGDGVPETFAGLPLRTRRAASRSIALLALYPYMYPIRRRGVMRGYRYFVADWHLFYYSVSSAEIRVAAIVPGSMRRA